MNQRFNVPPLLCTVLSTVSALFLSVSTPATHAQTLYATLSTGNGSYPQTAAFDNSRNLLYVVLNGSNAIDVISTTSGAVLKTINLAYNSNPQGIAVSPITGLVYVSDTSTNNVAIINPSASYSVSTVAGGTNPLAISVNAYNGKVYTVNQRGTVTVIDPSKSNAITTINTGLTNLNALAINQTTGAVYVTDLGAIGCGCNGSLVTINPTSNAFTKTSTGASPGSIAIDPTTGNVFVGNLGSNNVSFYNSSGTPYASSVAVGAHPDGLVVDGSGLLYVRNSGSGTVSVVNPQAGYTVTNITVGSFPSAYNDQQTLSFDSGVNLVAVGITGGVAYIDPTTLSVKTIVSLTSNPSELISNPAAQQTYSVSTPGYGAVNILRD